MTTTIDLSDLDFWARPRREWDKTFAALRAADEPVFCPREDGPGFYAITRYDQIAEASRNPQLFSSEPIAVGLDDPPPEVAALLGSMLSLDDPRHAQLRRIVARAFTPRMISKAAEDVSTLATEIVDSLVLRGPCDFVAEVAMPMPLEIVCRMMGVPDSVRPEVVEATNALIGALGDPDHQDPGGKPRSAVLADNARFLHELMRELARHRREKPADDIITAMVAGDVSGEALSDADLGKFFVLLVVAGNETTRNALSHALTLFTDHPEQRDLLLADLDERMPAAIEEVIRYATPVNWMRRTVARDTELLGHAYREGDRLIMYYVSANRDETVFVDPYRFNIMRNPNPHLGFGSRGPHFCLGAHLARREISLMLRELFIRVPDIHATAEPVRQRASFVNGVLELPCAF
ncbi:cytochrome P450 [Saccharopolyspora dendranthemae]|uniref:Cytochrome P450 n=1 Tax=Saccharopolyspora dendranthemae TaxID=1181886 RepID=A0A561V8L6_9PSEU|nr:cytochrome P450 [Saccharopolyspora dendranthemae]TWG07962.1 cytochrome P450 [Saccharopolyspora dendranthemae]